MFLVLYFFFKLIMTRKVSLFIITKNYTFKNNFQSIINARTFDVIEGYLFLKL